MRFLLTIAVALFAAPAFAGPASDAVRYFYSPEVSISDPQNRDRFVDPALAQLAADDRLSDGGTEIGCIDFAMQYDAQDLDDEEVAKTLKLTEMVAGDTAEVTAEFRLFPGDESSRRSILWSLRNVGGAWKIADIASAGGDWRFSEFDCAGGTD